MTRTTELTPLLKRLQLGPMADTLSERIALARREQLDYASFLEIILSDEINRRAHRRIELRLKNAGFEEICRLEDFDWTASIALDRRLLDAVFSLEFLDKHEHVLLVGPAGVGKSFMAQALGYSAVRAGHTVRFSHADDFFKAMSQARVGKLPLAAGGVDGLIVCIRIGMLTAAVHRQGTDAHVNAAHRLGFSLGRRHGRFPAGDAGIPAAVALSDGDLVGDAFRDGAGHPNAAEVGQPDASVAVVLDELHAGGRQERPRTGAVLLVEDRLESLDLFVQPAGAGITVAAACALSHELADPGNEGQGRIDVLGGVELLLQFMGREPEVRVPAGLVIAHHAVVHEACDAHATLCIALLPAGEF